MQFAVGLRILQSIDKLRSHLLIHKRFRFKTKWATNRKKKGANELALEHFDKYYAPIFKDKWPSIRLALLSQQKHCALVNNFSDSEQTVVNLITKGADDIIKIAADKKITLSSHDTNDHQQPGTVLSRRDKNNESNDDYQTNSEHIINEQQEDLLSSRTDINHFVSTSTVYTDQQLVAMEERAQFQVPDIDVDMIRAPSIGLPYHLKVHAFSPGDVSVFPQPKADKAGLLNYYPLDAASIVSVIALNLEPGNNVLDLCAAPGGKTLAMLQTMLPGKITCVDRSHARVNRLKQVLRSYFPGSYEGHVEVLHMDATKFEGLNSDRFDRVLVDVPCTTDRHVLQEEFNNIFRPSRARERLDLPKLQKDLLCAGIQQCKVGGSIVYTTCSLSPGQNDAVIQATLEHIWHHTKINLVVEDLHVMTQQFEGIMKFYDKCRFGQLILPSLKNNFGPMYISKLKRVE